MPRFIDISGTPPIAAAQDVRDAIGVNAQTVVNVKDYGAVGDGVTDDTAAIEAAFAVNGGIYFPPGTYNYTGTGLTGSNAPTILGAGRCETFIDLTGGDYLLDISIQLLRLDVRDIAVFNGKGAIRHTYTGANVTYGHIVERCEFRDYTECAIASDASDMPYWRIRNCYFESANTTDTIGVALGGGPDDCVIDSCSFVENRVHLTAYAGNNLQISNCDFLQYSTVASGGARASVWIRPGTSSTNSGPGMVVRNCKFGNENLVGGDYRILYADQDTGTHNGNKMPKLSADSTGYIIGHRISECMFMNIGGGDNSIIYSTTPNVRAVHVVNCCDDGSTYMLEFRTAPTTASATNSQNVFGPLTCVGISGAAEITRISNAVGVGYVSDPAGVIQDSSVVRGAGSSAAYAKLLDYGPADFFMTGGSVASGTDVFGGSNAGTFTFTSTSGTAQRVISSMTPDVPLFIEFDLKNPNDGNALEQVSVYLQDNAGAYHWARVVDVPSVAQGWVTYQFHFVPRTAGSSPRIFFANSGGLTNKTITVGRPRVYHGSCSQIGGQRPTIAAAATDAATTQTLANDLRSKLIDLGIISA